MWRGRRLFANLCKAVRFYLAVKVALIVVSFVPAVIGLPLPFSPVQIVFLELFMDLGASTSFVNLSAEPGLMNSRPRNPRAALLDRPMLFAIFSGGLCLAAMTGAAFLVGLHWMGPQASHTMALLAWLPGHAALGAAMSRQSLRQLAGNRPFVVWSMSATFFAVAVSLLPALGSVLSAATVAVPVVIATVILALMAPIVAQRLLALGIPRLRTDGSGLR